MTEQSKNACCAGQKTKCCSTPLNCMPCLILWGIVALILLGKLVFGY